MQFWYPPRPEKAILLGVLIRFYEQRGFVAQIKKKWNVFDRERWRRWERDVFLTRHGEAHKAWTPTEEAKDWFGRYPDSSFVFELLHRKGGEVRDTIYLFDVLKMKGTDQVGFPLRGRLCLLNTLPVSGKISVARSYHKDLTALYRGLSDPLDEGIVLKNPGGRPSRMSIVTALNAQLASESAARERRTSVFSLTSACLCAME